MDPHITKSAILGYLDAQGTVAPETSPAWTKAEEELRSLLTLAAERKQPKPDAGQLVYKCGRELLKEAVGADHPLARWDGASLEMYLHVSRDGQLLAVRRRGRTSRKQG